MLLPLVAHREVRCRHICSFREGAICKWRGRLAPALQNCWCRSVFIERPATQVPSTLLDERQSRFGSQSALPATIQNSEKLSSYRFYCTFSAVQTLQHKGDGYAGKFRGYRRTQGKRCSFWRFTACYCTVPSRVDTLANQLIKSPFPSILHWTTGQEEQVFLSMCCCLLCKRNSRKTIHNLTTRRHVSLSV